MGTWTSSHTTGATYRYASRQCLLKSPSCTCSCALGILVAGTEKVPIRCIYRGESHAGDNPGPSQTLIFKQPRPRDDSATLFAISKPAGRYRLLPRSTSHLASLCFAPPFLPCHFPFPLLEIHSERFHNGGRRVLWVKAIQRPNQSSGP